MKRCHQFMHVWLVGKASQSANGCVRLPSLPILLILIFLLRFTSCLILHSPDKPRRRCFSRAPALLIQNILAYFYSPLLRHHLYSVCYFCSALMYSIIAYSYWWSHVWQTLDLKLQVSTLLEYISFFGTSYLHYFFTPPHLVDSFSY